MILFQYTAASAPHFALVSSGDVLLFRQDACYLLLTNTSWPTTQLYALEQDMADRQVPCPASVTLLSDSQWVELCLKAQQVLLC
jgi:sulfur relay protein TusB/DsrH